MCIFAHEVLPVCLCTAVIGTGPGLGLVILGLAGLDTGLDTGVDALGWQNLVEPLVLNNQLLTRQLMGRNSQDPWNHCNF